MSCFLFGTRGLVNYMTDLLEIQHEYSGRKEKSQSHHQNHPEYFPGSGHPGKAV